VRRQKLLIDACTRTLTRQIKNGELNQEYNNYIEEVCESAIRGRELELYIEECRDEGQLITPEEIECALEHWSQWLKWSTVILDENDYLEVAVHALNIAPILRGTDYGTSRQRDLGQLWTDTIRGFLGEKAFQKWVKRAFNVSIELDYRRGSLEEYLPTDIKYVITSDGIKREPKIRISIKTTKIRGIWLDIPYAQIGHSDVFVLVKVGVEREHFLAFLKKISVIKDKFLKKAIERGFIDEADVEKLWKSLPDFEPIPAYIAGYFDKRNYINEVSSRKAIIEVDGEMKRTRFIINKYIGYWKQNDDNFKNKILEILKQKYNNIPDNVKIEFEAIGGFSSALRFLVNSGSLKRKREDWQMLIKKI